MLKLANQNGAMEPIHNFIRRTAEITRASENFKRLLSALVVGARHVPPYFLRQPTPAPTPDQLGNGKRADNSQLHKQWNDYVFARLDNIGFKDMAAIG